MTHTKPEAHSKKSQMLTGTTHVNYYKMIDMTPTPPIAAYIQNSSIDLDIYDEINVVSGCHS